MSHYDFDAPVDRRGTDSLKFDRAEEQHHSPDLLSLWVADMDFRAPDEVLDAIEQRTRHGIFGYSSPGNAYYAAVEGWLGSRYGLEAPREHIVITPGVVFALAACVRAFTKPGDAVLIQRPVYYPFSSVVEMNGRELVNAPLVYDGIGYAIDLAAFERTVAERKPKLFILCNPHNPVGRAWTPGELEAMGRICAEHDVLVVSDEIHMDFARPGFAHTPFAVAAPELAHTAITCTSASKTFNLAGLQVANMVVPDEQLRYTLRKSMLAGGFAEPNVLGMVATQAAYEHGAGWLAELKEYLEGNWALVADHLAAHAPNLHLVPAQSTYLAWVDCNALGLAGKQLDRFVQDEAGLWLDDGLIFGPEGEGFTRINIATQRAYLQRALSQLTDAMARL